METLRTSADHDAASAREELARVTGQEQVKALIKQLTSLVGTAQLVLWQLHAGPPGEYVVGDLDSVAPERALDALRLVWGPQWSICIRHGNWEADGPGDNDVIVRANANRLNAALLAAADVTS